MSNEQLRQAFETFQSGIKTEVMKLHELISAKALQKRLEKILSPVQDDLSELRAELQRLAAVETVEEIETRVVRIEERLAEFTIETVMTEVRSYTAVAVEQIFEQKFEESAEIKNLATKADRSDLGALAALEGKELDQTAAKLSAVEQKVEAQNRELERLKSELLKTSELSSAKESPGTDRLAAELEQLRNDIAALSARPQGLGELRGQSNLDEVKEKVAALQTELRVLAEQLAESATALRETKELAAVDHAALERVVGEVARKSDVEAVIDGLKRELAAKSEQTAAALRHAKEMVDADQDMVKQLRREMERLQSESDAQWRSDGPPVKERGITLEPDGDIDELRQDLTALTERVAELELGQSERPTIVRAEQVKKVDAGTVEEEKLEVKAGKTDARVEGDGVWASILVLVLCMMFVVALKWH